MAVFLESSRLWYRAPEPADVPRITVWINDPRVRRHLATRVFPLSLLAEQKWIERINPDPTQAGSDHVVLLFGPKGGDVPIGSTGLHGINWIARRAEWGILIGEPEQWNRGFGREVARRMLHYGFAELNLHRIELRVNTANLAGIKAYEAAGFVREGTLRDAAWVDGHHENILVMSVLRQEWQDSGEA